MKLKSKKSALLMSFTSLLICFAMLVGSTFAWFTDTASTGVNKITSGNLHVEIQNKENQKIETLEWVKENGDVIANQEDILWEPGCTYLLTPFQIVNTGNLALKYKIVITGLDGDSPLLNVIKFTYKTASGEEFDVSAEGHLAANGGSTGMITVSAHMDEAADNRYQDKELTNIRFTVYATQDTVENDSYGPDYDKQAAYATSLSDLDGVKVAEDGALTFTKDVNLTGQPNSSEQVKVLKDATINFAENKLTGTLQIGETDSDPANVTVKGNASENEYNIQANYRKSETGAMKQSAAIQVYKPTVTIESGKYTCNNAVINCQVQGVFGADGTQWKWSATNPQPLPTEFMTAVKVEGGQFDAYNNGSVVAAIIGKVVISDGTFNALGNGSECVYVKPSDSNQETSVTINGGTFNSNNNMFVLRNYSKTALVTVNGGTFTLNSENGSLLDGDGTLIINGGTFNVDPSAYVANGHTVTNNGNGTWTVQ